eukprot:4545855-Ditylum_brightwellii.AAC.1
MSCASQKFKRQKIAETNLFTLLDIDPSNQKERQQLDVDAIIKEAERNPQDKELMYTFSAQHFP